MAMEPSSVAQDREHAQVCDWEAAELAWEIDDGRHAMMTLDMAGNAYGYDDEGLLAARSPSFVDLLSEDGGSCPVEVDCGGGIYASFAQVPSGDRLIVMDPDCPEVVHRQDARCERRDDERLSAHARAAGRQTFVYNGDDLVPKLPPPSLPPDAPASCRRLFLMDPFDRTW